MTRRKKLRLAAGVMLGAAVVFVACAMSCPTCGTPFGVPVKAAQAFYKLYVVVMAGLFGGSFVIKK